MNDKMTSKEESILNSARILGSVYSKFREIILKHRPGTLDNEMPSLIAICAEASIVAVNSAAKVIDNTSAVNAHEPGNFKID